MLMNMKDILAVAKENRFALPAFNISDYSMFLGIMEVCEETNSPVIIEIHPDELSFIGSEMVTAIKEKAYKSPVPVCIHLDHCSDFGKIVWAIQSGFTSVMFDGAELPFEENIAGTKKIIEAAHPVNVSVEAELGTIGTTNPDEMEGGAAKIIYTDPEDAVKFVAETGVDTLAIAIGTCHGLYPAGMKPELKLDILKDIASKVDIPLVLHGGTGIPDDMIKKAIDLGVAKINVNTECQLVFADATREYIEAGKDREGKGYDPRKLLKPGYEAIIAKVKEKMELWM